MCYQGQMTKHNLMPVQQNCFKDNEAIIHFRVENKILYNYYIALEEGNLTVGKQ